MLPTSTIAGNILTLGEPKEKDLKIYLFSKHLQFLDYNGMSEAAKEMGFDGLDLTVRPGGHVLPERVSEDLPKAVEAMKKFDLQPLLMTTNVTDATSSEDITLLETASRLDFKYYRMGWLKYPEGKTISESIDAYTQQFVELEELNRKLSLTGAYQNHAGKSMGAPIWDLFQILKDNPSNYIGSQYDIRHAIVEGANSWELGLELIKPFIKTIVIKDFKWGETKDGWKPVNTPLGEGMVNFDRYFSLLKTYGINVPVSLHLEYDLGGAEHGKSEISISKKEIFNKMKKDLTFIKDAWARAKGS